MAGQDWQGKLFYQVLGVEPSASLEEIKSEYRWLARKFHPDQNDGDERAARRFRDITEAYEVLSKPNERAKYDAFLESGQSTSRTRTSAPPPPRRERQAPQQKPPYRNPSGTTPPEQKKPPPRAAHQGQTRDESTRKSQGGTENQANGDGSTEIGDIPAVSWVVAGLLLAFIIMVLATIPGVAQNESQVAPPQTVEPVGNDASEDFCEMVFRDDRWFETKADLYAFWSKLDNGLDKLSDSGSLVRNRGEILLTRTKNLVRAWDSGSENDWQASWESYLRAEGFLAEQCGYTLEQ